MALYGSEDLGKLTADLAAQGAELTAIEVVDASGSPVNEPYVHTRPENIKGATTFAQAANAAKGGKVAVKVKVLPLAKTSKNYGKESDFIAVEDVANYVK